MRFVLAIAAFVLAAVMIVFGIAQRTVLLEPAAIKLNTTISSDARYAVIEPSALSAHPGTQTITVSGAKKVFMAYGRSADVKAWIGSDAYTGIGHKAGGAALTTTERKAQAAEKPEVDPAAADAAADPAAAPVAPADPAAAAPAADAGASPSGSDLWLEQYNAYDSLTTSLSVPKGISMIIASDGTDPAPSKVTMSWAADNSTPFAGPLIVGGAVMMLIGLALYLWALIHLGRSRGPRRNLPPGRRMPRLPRAPRPKAIKASEINGRRSITRRVAIIPVALVTTLALGGCSASWWPGVQSSPAAESAPTGTGTGTPDPSLDSSPPAVTVPQLERIVSRISSTTKEADASLDADLLATRFVGPALEQRQASYTIRGKLADFAGPPAIPSSPLTLTLPQQSSSWPRTVMTVIQDSEDAKVAPMALVMRQDSPRENFLVEYAIQLEPAAKVPAVAPATIGAPLIAPDSKLLLVPPEKIPDAYGSVLKDGDASPSVDLFKAAGDSFREQVAKLKTDQAAKLETTALIEYGLAAGTGKVMALATNNSGSIVAVSLNETVVAKPTEPGASVKTVEGAIKALSGVTATAKGIQSTYSDQLLFHVPSAGSKDKIVLLGFAQGLISSSELP